MKLLTLICFSVLALRSSSYILKPCSTRCSATRSHPQALSVCQRQMPNSMCLWNKSRNCNFVYSSGVPRNFVRGEGGIQQIQLRSEDRENGDLGAVAP